MIRLLLEVNQAERHYQIELDTEQEMLKNIFVEPSKGSMQEGDVIPGKGQDF